MRILTKGMMVVAAVLVAGCGGKEATGPEFGEGATNTPSEEVRLEDVREETAEAVGAAVALADQTKEEYVAKLKSDVDDVEERLESLRARSKTLGEEARETWNERIAQLAKQKEALQRNLADVMDATSGAWQELGRGMTKAREDMAEALRKAEAEFERPSAGALQQTPPGEEG